MFGISKSFGCLTLLLAALVINCPLASSETLVETSFADRLDVQQLKQAPPKSGPKKIGLALGGGGARGAAHVGVMKVLDAEGIKFDYIAGTSIGSVVGGLYSAGVPLSKMEDDFESGALMKHFMTMPIVLKIITAPILAIPRMFGRSTYDGLYRGTPFKKYLLKELPTHDHKIEHLKIPFAAVTLNLLDGKPYMIRSGDLGAAMQASSSVPALRKPVEFGGKLLVDGGVICNLPVKQVREMGADFVIAVNIDEPFEPITDLKHFKKFGSVAQRMISWGLWDTDSPQAALADVNIHPDTSGITLISTKKSDAVRGCKAGEAAARAALPEIRRKLKELNGG